MRLEINLNSSLQCRTGLQLEPRITSQKHSRQLTGMAQSQRQAHKIVVSMLPGPIFLFLFLFLFLFFISYPSE